MVEKEEIEKDVVVVVVVVVAVAAAATGEVKHQLFAVPYAYASTAPGY